MAEQQQIAQTNVSAKTFFDREKFYEPVPENGEIALAIFLEKTKEITLVFEHFGAVFSPVKSDMENNIKKILAALKNPKGGEYKTIQELITDEMARGVYKDGSSGTVAGVWLGRGLKFMYLFFEQLVLAHKNGNMTESNTEFVKIAYAGALKEHHNFVSRGVFSVVCHGAPYRSDLCKRLMRSKVPDDVDAKEINNLVLTDMEEYLKNLKETTDTWNSQCMEILQDKYKRL
ncbi:glycolipid transfer protein-like [Pecten maximus]|uniref:glycolipid transfer protein-like n=1 Tax=Pecten maximus TaxID=6579 RepID=UPI0014588C41|nr:glycolipid transfer protein-like [Pecten maximus]